ncbi:DUF736 domain-containing protein [Lichenifustis flavocetrariae]|uniref:DUF736 domain-containing protein n=1 Tax=Lichenifustis flavocetrariae TaxID=2949735 RepID=A0AA42CLQ9_9HYPH|nr:DUF736 domain-containing protein [Lichenifustis flavocetrariae]MCW6511884.1 DUF736 domain-containing protein [Lichenifustis flavocetrariae]
MTTIGTFKAQGNEFSGSICTLTIRANDIRIVPVTRGSENGPSHRVHAGAIEIGAAWAKRSREGRPYLSVLLDDPSLMSPVYACLLADENGKGHSLLWSRGKQRDGE